MEYKKFEDNDFANLFANHRFKREYSNYILGLLRKLYQPDGKWGKLLGAEGNYGVIDTEIPLDKAPMSKQVREFYISVHENKDPKWSLLNYVNTHWTSFVHIINVVNYWIDTGQITSESYFTFKNDPFKELERLKVILNKTGEYIFMPKQNLTTFWKIMGAIARTTYLGNIGENLTLEYISALGKITDIVKSQPGMRVDTLGGVDISFKLNGIKKTLQCKMFGEVKFADGQYSFLGISNPSEYNVDFFSFVNKRNVYLFDTQKDGLRYRLIPPRTYVFDKRLLKFKFDI
jgi:hypothetical protein